jgi:hypothetical protein
MQTLKPAGRLGLVLHPRTDPTPVVEKLASWARSHGKKVIVGARDAERYQRRSGVKLSLLDLLYLPEEMRDVLPGGDPVALTLDG